MRQGGVLAAGGAEAGFLTTPLAVSVSEIDSKVGFCGLARKLLYVWHGAEHDIAEQRRCLWTLI